MPGNFSAGGKQEHGRELHPDFLMDFCLRLIYIHLQCFRLRFFSFSPNYGVGKRQGGGLTYRAILGTKNQFWRPQKLSCTLIGASFACPDRRGDRAVRGDRPSKPQRRSGGGCDLHLSALFRTPQNEPANPDMVPPESFILYFLGIFPGLACQPVCYDEQN